jgi:hypothetical protein
MTQSFRTRAMMDMAAAFGQGARKGKRVSWGPQVAELAETWLGNRLDASKVDYWSVRDKALQRAYEVGQFAATLAASQGKSTILVSHLRNAIEHFEPKGYCPF